MTNSNINSVIVGRETCSGLLQLVAVFETHSAMLPDYFTLVRMLLEFDLTPVGLPQEEGWHSMQDLSEAEWDEVRSIYRRTRETRYL